MEQDISDNEKNEIIYEESNKNTDKEYELIGEELISINFTNLKNRIGKADRNTYSKMEENNFKDLKFNVRFKKITNNIADITFNNESYICNKEPNFGNKLYLSIQLPNIITPISILSNHYNIKRKISRNPLNKVKYKPHLKKNTSGIKKRLNYISKKKIINSSTKYKQIFIKEIPNDTTT